MAVFRFIFKLFDLRLTSKSFQEKRNEEIKKLQDMNVRLYEDAHEVKSIIKKVKDTVNS